MQKKSTGQVVDRFVLLLRSQMTANEAGELADPEGVFSALRQRWTRPDMPGHGFWAKLAERTQISALSWRNAYSRRQRPTVEMLEAMGRLWPRYAFWLATGITDASNGHVAPLNAVAFPERLYAEDFWGNEYFRAAIELQDRLIEESGIDQSDDEERLRAQEREPPRWTGGKLVDKAYELSQSSEYADLIALWEQREKDRAATMDKVTGRDRPWEHKQDRPASSSDVLVGGDPRTAHQSSWDLFYKPRQSSGQRK